MIDVNGFLHKYIAVLSDEQYDKIEDCLLGVSESPNFTKEEIKALDEKLAAINIYNERLSSAAQRNNKGIALEKTGNIESAINVYEENIEEGFPATHSFERLMVIYRKLKKYEDETRVIRRALTVFAAKNPEACLKYTKRLEKVRGMLKE